MQNGASRALGIALALVIGAGCSGGGDQGAATRSDPVEAAFASARQHGNLKEFLAPMPLGGELHHHLSGALWAEDLIEIGAAAGLCIDPETGWMATHPPCAATARPLREALDDTGFHDGIAHHWSMLDYGGGDANAAAHFFSIFGRIPAVIEDVGTVVARLREQAAREHVSYIETILEWPPATAQVDAIRLRRHREPLDQVDRLLKDPQFQQARDTAVAALDGALRASDEILGCDSDTTQARPAAGCEVVVRFVHFVFREAPLRRVLARALLAYEVASRATSVVGTDIVGPETGAHTRVDYADQMRLLGALGARYPGVGRAVHAGELNPDAVDADLTRHVTLATQSIADGGAGAMRLGHAVSVLQEPDAEALLERLHSVPIPVVVNLRSNELLLGVSGASHPLPRLLEAGVPVALSTDDPGILRTTLLEQFVAAAAYPTVHFADLERFARNSLAFGFIEGDGLWLDPDTYEHPVEACRGLLARPGHADETCRRWAAGSARGRLQLRLEQDLSTFRAAVEAAG